MPLVATVVSLLAVSNVPLSRSSSSGLTLQLTGSANGGSATAGNGGNGGLFANGGSGGSATGGDGGIAIGGQLLCIISVL